MKTYLVTGVAGFIGQRTAQLLLERGDAVVGLDSLNDYYDVRLKQHRLEELTAQPDFRFVQGDIVDAAVLESLFGEHAFAAVYHLAARAGVRYSVEEPGLYMQTNVTGALNVMEAMRKHDVKKLLLASTSSLYADEAMPFKEDSASNTPRSPYAASKKGAEALAYTYHFLHGLDVSVLRYFTVYGPAGRPDMSPLRFIRWIDAGTPITLYGDGTQGRDFTFVDDIAKGTLLAEKPLGYEIINLGCGQQPVRMNDFIAIIEELLGKQAVIDRKPFLDADMLDTMADITKAGKLLGWQPQTSLRAGLEKTVDWYCRNREWLLQFDF